MHRTSIRRRRQWMEFWTANRRLFPFVGLYLAGAAIGVAVFCTAGSRITGDWGALLRVSGLTGGLKNGLSALWNACFPSFLWLAALFLLGLWPCGAPFVLLVPLLQGLGLGLTEAYYYSLGWWGVAATAAVILPASLAAATVLTMVGAESLRLSAGLSRQLLPGCGAPPETLPPAFRLYCLRFLLFLAGAAGAGLFEVLLRTLLAGLLR